LAGVCEDVLPFQLPQAGELNGLPGSGVFTGAGVNATGLFDPGAAGPGNHTIRYTYTSTGGCTNAVEQVVPVFALPVANAGPDRVVLEGGNITIMGSGTGNGLTYLWTPATGLDNPGAATPKASPTADITYRIQVTTAEGCTDTDEMFIRILLKPIIPNVFSPNGDGINDTWEITSLESYPGATVEIFNRYGQVIFRSTGYSKPWDGKVNGKDAPSGTYYYIVDPKNGRQKMAGFVDIVR
jgi:gliding motility-associated-like protein